MPLVVPNVGKINLLAEFFPTSLFNLLEIRPYTSDVAPDAESVTSDFSFAIGRGLDAIAIGDSAEWSAPAIVSGRAQAQYGTSAQQWTLTGSGDVTVYGYVVTIEGGGDLIWAERFASPIEMVPGGTLQILPVLTLDSEY
jgi:hypothetical protein